MRRHQGPCIKYQRLSLIKHHNKQLQKLFACKSQNRVDMNSTQQLQHNESQVLENNSLTDFWQFYDENVPTL